MIKLNTVKERILAAFFVYSTISFAVSTTSFLLFRNMENIDKATSEVNKLYNQTLNGLRIGQEFFAYEIYESEFYVTGLSETLTEHNDILQEVSDQVLFIREDRGIDDLEMTDDLTKLAAFLQSYRNIYDQIVLKLKRKGFKEYGLIGDMRRKIHDVEEELTDELELVLLLRRNEKDYLLRKDTTYYSRVAELSNEISQVVLKKSRLSDYKKRLIANQLQEYNDDFREVITIDFELGFHSSSLSSLGDFSKLKKKISEISELVAAINAKAEKRKFELNTSIQTVLVSIVTLSVILTLFLSLSFKFVLEDDPDKIEDL